MKEKKYTVCPDIQRKTTLRKYGLVYKKVKKKKPLKQRNFIIIKKKSNLIKWIQLQLELRKKKYTICPDIQRNGNGVKVTAVDL